MKDKFDYTKFRSREYCKALADSIEPWKYEELPNLEYGWHTVGDADDDIIDVAFRKAISPLILGDFMDKIFDAGLKWVESPIEMLMYVSLCLNAFVETDGIIIQPPEDKTEPTGLLSYPTRFKVTIKPQVEIGNYRVDFLIECDAEWTIKGITSRGHSEVIVETDGHEFHEKTKEQASRDKKRDRDLVQRGYKLFHYSGADVFAEPIYCGYEVISHLVRNASWETRDSKNKEVPIFKYWKK